MLLAPATAAAQPPGCRVDAPINMTPGAATWLGDCEAGRAAGAGVLRVAGLHGGVELFFGTMGDGRPVIGIVARNARYEVARRPGDTAPDREREIAAFIEASEAAQAVSRRFQASGNPASAAFYASESAKLGNELE